MTMTFRGLGVSMGKSPSENGGRSSVSFAPTAEDGWGLPDGYSRFVSDRNMFNIVLEVEEGRGNQYVSYTHL